MPRPSPFRALTAALTAFLAACGSGKQQESVAGRSARSDREVAQDAQGLSHELFELVDRAASYRSSHSGRNPGNLRDLGVDSLTQKTARWLVVRGREPLVTVAYRHPDAGGVRSCTGGLSVLEEQALEGRIKLQCRTTDGASREVSVDPSTAH